MFRLPYISTTRAPHTPEAVEAILRTARRNNAAADITGLLLASGNRFLQVLEEPEQRIRETYQRISGQSGHRTDSFARQLRALISDIRSLMTMRRKRSLVHN